MLNSTWVLYTFSKVRLFKEHICTILSSIKTMITLNNKSPDFVLIWVDVLHIENDHNFDGTEDHTNVL